MKKAFFLTMVCLFAVACGEKYEDTCLGGSWQPVGDSGHICVATQSKTDAGTSDAGSNTVCQPGAMRSCGYTLGECEPGTQYCLSTGQWGYCTGGVWQSTETCDYKDNDCDGDIDEGNVCGSSAPDAGTTDSGNSGGTSVGNTTDGTSVYAEFSIWIADGTKIVEYGHDFIDLAQKSIGWDSEVNVSLSVLEVKGVFLTGIHKLNVRNVKGDWLCKTDKTQKSGVSQVKDFLYSFRQEVINAAGQKVMVDRSATCYCDYDAISPGPNLFCEIKPKNQS
ncbi:MAG: hypothetical protein Q8M83_06290 [bacterium]|nr:hypothetical protein [bacterium]